MPHSPTLLGTRDALPAPLPAALEHSRRVVGRIRADIVARGGAISFARFMELALYAPGLGYYSAGARKLGPDGDFVTASEITPLFGQTLARQARALIARGLTDILEIGAGSGALAADLLDELERIGSLPCCYSILELSADLRERARAHLAAHVPQLVDRIVWLDRMPDSFEGLVIGNEVLDAMPVELVRCHGADIDQVMVEWSPDEHFSLAYRPAEGELRAAAIGLGLDGIDTIYTTEIGLAACGFMRSIAGMLRRGVALFLDYGFPRGEFYHPERSSGTLMCHYRHRAHGDPFFLPGLQDITAHVDFSAMAKAGRENGATVLGYASQAHFLINCGITKLLARVSPADTARYLPLANAAQRLLSPSEMGELFKVIAIGKNWEAPLIGFARSDRSSSL